MRHNHIRTWVAAVACCGMTFSPAMAAPPGQAPLVADVALADGGVFSGQVVDAQGHAVAGAQVAIAAQGREAGRMVADADGRFSFANLKGGVYELATPAGREVYRLWSPRTAPPAARQAVLVVMGSEAVRGQYAPPPMPIVATGPPGMPQPGPFSKAANWVSNHPFITAGIVATAIAVPVAVAVTDEDDDAS